MACIIQPYSISSCSFHFQLTIAFNQLEMLTNETLNGSISKVLIGMIVKGQLICIMNLNQAICSKGQTKHGENYKLSSTFFALNNVLFVILSQSTVGKFIKLKKCIGIRCETVSWSLVKYMFVCFLPISASEK